MASLYRRTRALLEQAGCTFVREGKGSHEIWFSPLTGQKLTVPSNLSLPTTANKILKDAGLPKAF